MTSLLTLAVDTAPDGPDDWPMVDTQAPRGRLSRDVLVDGALRIVDAEGPEALTLRRLGAELGVDPTAVYRHFRTKDELLAVTADRLLRDALDTFERTSSWQDDLRRYVLQVREIYLAHPRMATLIATASAPLENEPRLTEQGLAILRAAGLPDDETALAFEAIEAYALGVSSMDGAGPATSDAWWRAFAALPPDEFPALTTIGRRLYQDPEARFAFGLDLLLEAIAVRAAARKVAADAQKPVER
jgi:AcrR family transcriptional regulator